MKNQVSEYVLNAENIDLISEDIHNFIVGKKYYEGIALKTRLSVEMILLHWMENAAEGNTVSLEYIKSFGRIHVRLRLKGASISDPLETSEDDFQSTLLTNMETTYTYTFTRGENVVDFKLPMLPVSNLAQVFIAAALALLLGNAMGAMLPADVNLMVSTNYVTPLFKTILGILSTFACFMVFFSILSSVSSMGNVATLKSMGKEYLKQIISSTVICGAISMAIGTLVFDVVTFDKGSGVSVFDKIFAMLVDTIPVNIFGAFYKGNMLQIAVLSLFVGVIMLMLGDEVATVRKQLGEYNKLFQYAIRIICKCTPLLIFLSLMKLILSNTISVALASWKILAMNNVCYILVLVSVTVATCIHCKIPLTAHIKKSLPLYFMGFSAGASVPCLPAIRKQLESYRVDQGIIDFALPIGVVISKRARVVYYIILVLGISSVFGKSIASSQLVVLLFSSLLLANATPSIPGGPLAIVSLLLEQYGLPLEAVGVAISLSLLDAMPAGAVKVVTVFDDVLYLQGSIQKDKA